MELFQLLRDGVPRTRAELAKSTGLARSTVAARVDELMRIGLIAPVAEAASTGGRPPSQFALNPSARVVVAADIGASHATVAIIDLTGAILAERSEPLDIAAGPRGRADVGRRAAAGAAGRERPRGQGARRDRHRRARPGRALHRPAGEPADHAGLGSLRRAGLGAAAPARCPVLVDNDVNIMALGERAVAWPRHRASHVREDRDRHRAGVISGGLLQRGAQGVAGDIGHVRVARGSDCPVPLRQSRLSRGARVGPGDRPDAPRAGTSGRERQRRRRARARAATSTPSRPCVRPAVTSARC